MSDERALEASHFFDIAQALISRASSEECLSISNLVNWRWRELRSEQVRKYKPGEVIVYLLPDSKTQVEGTIHHLNRFSVSIHKGNGQYEAIPVERILRWKKAIVHQQALAVEVSPDILPGYLG